MIVFNHVLCAPADPQVGGGTGSTSSSTSGSQPNPGSSDAGPIRATAPMWRCSRIMHMQRDLHPTILSSLEGIVDQVHYTSSNCSYLTNLSLLFYTLEAYNVEFNFRFFFSPHIGFFLNLYVFFALTDGLVP